MSIIHPGLLPDHQLIFLDRIETGAEIGVFATNPQGAVDEYNPDADYFPDKVEANWAKDWTVSYHGNYKLLHMGPVGDANAGSRETYVLVQKGTPAPELTGNLADAYVIQVPIETLFETSGGGVGSYSPRIPWRGRVPRRSGIRAAGGFLPDNAPNG